MEARYVTWPNAFSTRKTLPRICRACLLASRGLTTSAASRARTVATKARSEKPLPYSPSRRSPPKKSSPTGSEEKPNPMRFRRTPLVLAGLSIFIVSAYSASLYVSYRREVAEGSTASIPADVSDRYDGIAGSFDASVETMESFIGLNKMRKRMAQQAAGHVCEVSIGTGRNLLYYDWDFQGVNGVGKVGPDHQIRRGRVKSFTAVDKSSEMLEIAHDKFSKEYPGILGVRWIIQDASMPLPGPPVSANERSGNLAGRKYDTIVQTMGLCSTPDPVGLLKNLGANIGDGGRILLLEHGRSNWTFVNNILDGLAPKHADRFGCWWNKNVEDIVKESGLEVVKLERRPLHFGTTYWIELRRPDSGIRVEDPVS